MRKKLKELFSKHSKAARRVALVSSMGLALALGADATNPPQPATPVAASVTTPEVATAPVTNVNDGVMYWKHNDYDIIAKTWPCDDRGLCASFQSINPDNSNNRYLMAELKGYAKKDEMGFWQTDPTQVQGWELTDYCGYQPDVHLKKQDDGSWDGTITSPFNGGTYGMSVRQMDDGRLKVSGYFTAIPFFSLSEKVSRVDTPPPQCRPDFPLF